VKGKLKDAIDNAHVCSDSGSGSDDTDDEEPTAAKLLQKKADDSDGEVPIAATPPQKKADESDGEVPIAATLLQKKADARHKAQLGDRNMVPRGEFFDAGRLDVLTLGVVSKHPTRGHTHVWFEGDDRATQHKGHLEEWDKHFVNAAAEDKMFKKANAEAEVQH
jgi:hypothetical protein